MKTLNELNSKWYWRLIKVLYSFLAILTVGGSIVGIYMEFGTYNPNDVIKVTDKIQNYDDRYQTMVKYVERFHGDYSSGNIWTYSSGGVLKPGILYYIYTIEKNPMVDGTYLICEDESRNSCGANDINEDSYGKYIKWGIKVPIPKYQIDEYRDFMERFTELKSSLNDFKKYGYGYSLISKYNAFFSENISDDKNYRGPKEWGLIIASSLGVMLGIVLFTFITRSILFYVILGKAFPKE